MDAQIYEHFVRKATATTPCRARADRRKRAVHATHDLRRPFWWSCPDYFRCVSVDLLARRPVVHRQGPLADVVGCSIHAFLYAPLPYGGTYVDGGVLDNVPVTTLAWWARTAVRPNVAPLAENQAPRPAAIAAANHGCPA